MNEDPESTPADQPGPGNESAAAETEERASAALYPERKVRADATARPAARRVPDGIDLAEIEAAILDDGALREADRARLLGAVRQLADYSSRHRRA